MFMIKDNDIYMNYGDVLHIYLKVRNKSFEPEDVLTMNITKENDYTKILATYTFTIEEESSTYTIHLTGSQTKIGTQPTSEPVTYWYEVRWNDSTIIGYDQNGPKKFILYPSGGSNEQSSI